MADETNDFPITDAAVLEADRLAAQRGTGFKGRWEVLIEQMQALEAKYNALKAPK